MAIDTKEFGLTEKGYGLTCRSPFGIGVSIAQARFEAIVDEIWELKRRVTELESKLKGDGK